MIFPLWKNVEKCNNFLLNEFYKVVFYVLALIMFILEILASIAVERKYELEADSYANCYSDPALFASAIKKVIKYECEDFNLFDELFQSHPSYTKRIEKDK